MGRKITLNGWVRIRVSAAHPEDVLNFCAERGVDFREARKCDNGVLEMRVTPEGYRYLEEHTRNRFSVACYGEEGTAKLKKRLSGRKCLPVMLLLCAVLAWGSSLFIWEVEVRGNETVSTAEILKALENYGVREGAFRLGVDQTRVTNGVLRAVTKLSWITVNTHGSRLTVLVREETAAPEMAGQEPAQIVADRGGVIHSITAQEGFACVSPGELVEAGEVLIASETESQFRGRRYLPARGQVIAETGRELKAAAPVSVAVMLETGESRSRYALKFGTNRLNFYFDSGNPYAECVKISHVYPLSLPFVGELPVSLICETFREVETVPSADLERTENALRETLRQSLLDALPEGSEILHEEYITEENGGALYVTLRAVCLEDIARTEKLQGSLPDPEE